jgi:rhodanese-related sulfurtransferase
VTARRALLASAVVLAALALVAGSPEPRAAGGAVDVGRLARSVEAEADHVTALELAAWIRDRKPGLRVVDVRAKADYDEFHVPTAEWIPLDRLASTPFKPGETVVLYSDGGAHAAQGWVFLQLAGHPDTFFLRGGLLDWLEDVMSPTLAAGASDSARAAYEEAAELSRYFGGEPRRETGPASIIPLPSGPPSEANRVRALIGKRKKRGC